MVQFRPTRIEISVGRSPSRRLRLAQGSNISKLETLWTVDFIRVLQLFVLRKLMQTYAITKVALDRQTGRSKQIPSLNKVNLIIIRSKLISLQTNCLKILRTRVLFRLRLSTWDSLGLFCISIWLQWTSSLEPFWFTISERDSELNSEHSEVRSLNTMSKILNASNPLNWLNSLYSTLLAF